MLPELVETILQYLIFDLHIPAERYVALYAGQARDIQARSLDGASLRFPGNILRPFVSHDGVQGRFRISFDENHKFQAIEKIV
ncbi:MAG: DUF2835 domain-containing protein [Pseudomonadales bacterium]|nr:DUF2835 domain-containing protein [Pseudomonadales bacterium]